MKVSVCITDKVSHAIYLLEIPTKKKTNKPWKKYFHISQIKEWKDKLHHS